ncbi:amphi-Trp domain-containing protein [Streptomyces sp. NPDC047461]|uniref:amphi-Trp domain-containing protein n=1 Tax=Streptomyces sp. NPDC047461 TaxID=3155619 RepID=UPI0033E7C17B
MKDLKFERKRSLSRLEAADQLAALAAALRKGGETEVELSPGTLSLRIPDNLRSEIEIEIGGGEIELEIEFTWPTASPGTAPSQTAAGAEKPTTRTRKKAPAKPKRSATGSNSATGAKRTATKRP